MLQAERFIKLIKKCHPPVTTSGQSGAVNLAGTLVMKVFKQLSPRQIARYIKSFHRGQFAIESLGIFEFRSGRISLEGVSCQRRLKLARQINQAIHQLTPSAPLVDL